MTVLGTCGPIWMLKYIVGSVLLSGLPGLNMVYYNLMRWPEICPFLNISGGSVAEKALNEILADPRPGLAPGGPLAVGPAVGRGHRPSQGASWPARAPGGLLAVALADPWP